MIVKDKRGRMKKEGDQFPIGMRVLVVDDDPTCLQLIHQLLLSCKYNVSATLEGGKALKMLRENKEEFDLVITDVDMPDIDGFKLLEEVGIKMDLPVIMVSGHNNHEIVMKGIKHGACDYLAKPVRLQELGNIWQHVIRRRKIDSRDENSSDDGEGCEKSLDENTEGAHAFVESEVSDRNEKINRKRKDLNKEDEDDDGETTQENDDASTGKKQRVVWSAELHNKFAQAVNELGIEKAVPKKILDLMNVDNLTRENVASHLQKYRLHLKKNTAATSQHVNMVAAFRGRQPSYLPMDAMEGFRNIHLLAGSRQLPTLVSFQPNSVLGRMNNPTGFGQHSLVPSGIYNNTSNSINDLGNHQVIGLQGIGNQHKIVQGTNKYFPGVFSGTGLATSSSSKSFSSATNNSLLLPANQQHTQSEIFGAQSSVRIPSLSLDPFKIGVGDSSLLPDIRRCNDTWQGVVPSNSYPAKASPMAALSSQNNNPPDNSAPVVSQMDKNLHASSSGSAAMAPLRDSLFENGILHQASSLSSGSVAMAPLCDSLCENGILNQASSLGSNTMLMPSGVNENSRFLRNSIDIWEGQNLNQNQPHNHNLLFSSTPSLPDLSIPEIIAENPTVNNGRNSSFPFLAEDRRSDLYVNYKEECTLETTNLHDGLGSSPCSYDDLISAMTRTERDDLTFFDDDLANDIFPLGTCT